MDDKTKKILIGIVCSLAALVLAFVIWVMVVGFPFFIGKIKGEKYYTQEEYSQYAAEQNDSLQKERNEYEKLYKEALERVSEQNSEIFDLQKQVTDLTKENNNLKNQVLVLQNDKDNLSARVEQLQAEVEENNATIKANETEIAEKQAQIVELQSQATIDQATISSLQSRIEQLQTINSQLNDTNVANVETIVQLNQSIKTLTSQILELNGQISTNNDTLNGLNSRILQLEKSIQAYETFISQFEQEDKVVATFEFDGGVYNIQLVNKGSAAVVGNPQSTEFVIFNYWEVDGQKVDDLSTYYLQKSTKFVANVTYKYSVKFMNGDQQIEEQIVEKNGYATAPSQQPAKDDFIFEGWTINGSDIVDVSSYSITKDTVFIAKFSKLATVTFMYEQDTKSTQQVKVGEHPQNVEVESTTYKKFNGWKVNGVLVENVEEYVVNGDTVFVADITYYFDVKFKVDESDYNSQVIVENGFAVKPADPTKQGYVFDYWTVDGSNQVDPTTYKITQTTNFIAKFTKTYEVTFDIQGQQQKKTVRIDEELTAPELHIDGQFIGWTTDNGLSLTELSEYELNGDVTFKAVIYDKIVGAYTIEGGKDVYEQLTSSSDPVLVARKDLYFGVEYILHIPYSGLLVSNSGAFMDNPVKYTFNSNLNRYEVGQSYYVLQDNGDLVYHYQVSYNYGQDFVEKTVVYKRDNSHSPIFEKKIDKTFRPDDKVVSQGALDESSRIIFSVDGTVQFNLTGTFASALGFSGNGTYSCIGSYVVVTFETGSTKMFIYDGGNTFSSSPFDFVLV